MRGSLQLLNAFFLRQTSNNCLAEFSVQDLNLTSGFPDEHGLIEVFRKLFPIDGILRYSPPVLQVFTDWSLSASGFGRSFQVLKKRRRVRSGDPDQPSDLGSSTTRINTELPSSPDLSLTMYLDSCLFTWIITLQGHFQAVWFSSASWWYPGLHVSFPFLHFSRFATDLPAFNVLKRCRVI